jgi:zinc protease
MLKEFHDTWYRPNNAILVIVGDVQPDDALAQVKKLFGDIPSRKLPARAGFKFEPVKPEMLNLDTDLPYGMAVVSYRLPGSDSPDYAASQILSDVLSSQRGRLYQLVPDGKALFSQFAYEAMPKAGMGYAIAGFPADGDATNLLEQVKTILTEETRNGALADLVEAAKRREIASAEFQKNSVSGLAMAWSQALAVEGRQSPEDDVEAIRHVTVDDVNRVARQYLDLDHAITAILSPQPSGKPISSKGFGGQESFAPSKTKDVKLPDWAAKALERVEVPASTLTPVVTTLSNGLKLIVQPESISDTVSVYGCVKNNAKVETARDKEGVDEVLDELFSYGTKNLDRIAFQKALDDIGASESAGADFSVSVLAADFDRGVELLAGNELSPALPEEAFQIIQPQIAASVAGRMKSPGYLASRSLTSALFPSGDPAQRQATPETIKSLTIQDVRDYYHHVMRPDLTTIVVIGKITPEHAREVVEKYFGDWQASGAKPDTLFPSVPPNRPATTHVPDTSRVQDEVTLAETLSLTRTNADFYALELGNHVLGGAFYATRLYRDLREQDGLVYYVASSFNIGETRGVYEVSYACDPPNDAKARAIVENNLRSMQTKDVTSRELHQAQALLLREIPLSEASMSTVAGGWLSRSMLDLPLDEPLLAAHHYLNLTPPEVRAAYAKWLRVEDLVQVTRGPATK